MWADLLVGPQPLLYKWGLFKNTVFEKIFQQVESDKLTKAESYRKTQGTQFQDF